MPFVSFQPSEGRTSAIGSHSQCKLAVILGLFLVTASPAGQAQGSFQNMGFENPIPPLAGIMWPQQAIPGWSAHSPGGDVGYNTLTLGGTALVLHDHNSPVVQPLLGNYSLALINGDEGGIAAVSQIGTIPVGSLSLRFLATSLTPVVSFAGNTLATQRVGGTARFQVLAADISSWAGQTGELRFSHTGMLDGISFSTVPVPEPHLIWLLLAGGMVRFVRRQHR